MDRLFVYLTLTVVLTEFHFVLNETPDSFKRPVYLEECSEGGVGPPGPPGPRGPRGPDALPEPVGKNWRQCSWNDKNDDRNDETNGPVFTCDFTKEYEDTSLYVSVSSNMRVAYTNGACCRWYFKFGNDECSTPKKIEAVTYASGYGVSYNLHRPRVLVGFCDEIPAGSVEVSVWVGACSGHSVFDCHTGWKSASHVIVEEVTPSPY